MKHVTVAKSTEVEVKPFVLEHFMRPHKTDTQQDPLSKKEIKQLAKKIGLVHNDDQIGFAKKIIAAYMAEK